MTISAIGIKAFSGTMENQQLTRGVTVLDRVLSDLAATERALAEAIRQARETGNPVPFLLEVVRIHDDIARTMERVTGMVAARARLDKP